MRPITTCALGRLWGSIKEDCCKDRPRALDYLKARQYWFFRKEDTRLKISQKGLYALEAVMTLGHRYGSGTVKIREIAIENDLPEKFLELILLELKNARIVESVRGAKGGYQLRRAPSEIHLSEIIRLIDGPLAPFGDADQLRSLIASDLEHRPLYEVFLRVRDSAAKILESTTVADLVSGSPKQRKRSKGKKGEKQGALLSIVNKGGASKAK